LLEESALDGDVMQLTKRDCDVAFVENPQQKLGQREYGR
jgi:hypothetical protein